MRETDEGPPLPINNLSEPKPMPTPIPISQHEIYPSKQLNQLVALEEKPIADRPNGQNIPSLQDSKPPVQEATEGTAGYIHLELEEASEKRSTQQACSP